MLERKIVRTANEDLPVIKEMNAVERMKKEFPDKEVLADCKIMDGGYLETENSSCHVKYCFQDRKDKKDRKRNKKSLIL